MKITVLCALLALLLSESRPLRAEESAKDYPVQPVPFTAVKFDDSFWAPRLETNRRVTIPYDFQKCEETGRLRNFEKAGGLLEGKHEGIFFNDSDVFKIVEGAVYSLAMHPDPELEAYVEDLIAKFGAAQEDDGYLYTARTIDPENPAPGAGPSRWANLRHAHELYNVGHMYEAAAAHYLLTGKRNFLDIALKNADLVGRVFGPDQKIGAPGHQEIEMGLAKLYRATGEQGHLDLAKFFLDMRGRSDLRELYGPMLQDHAPVLEQEEAVGHAVRAGYQYSGMADIAALTGEQNYIDAIDRIWENVVSKKLYLTGGIGARHHGEAFGDDYELPNRSAYNETCAAIANAMWNHRLFLLHGDAKYINVLERIIYNGFLSGISLKGNAFFYPNPLESDGLYRFNQGSLLRKPWFDCSCCPANVVRFLPSLPGYAYAQRKDRIYVNLFAGGSAEMQVQGAALRIQQETRYPWEGRVAMELTLDRPAEFSLLIRVPGWSRGIPAPGGLYRYLDAEGPAPTLSVNGDDIPITLEKGFAVLRQVWHSGDQVVLDLPMPIRRVLCDERVADNRGKVALERGPIVYCAEGVDNDGKALSLILADATELSATSQPELLGGIMALHGQASALSLDSESGALREETHAFTAVPYYSWAHRGETEMAVWLARSAEAAQAPLPKTLAASGTPSASHGNASDSLVALHDQKEAKHSNDQGIPRFTWWDHRGTSEWVQYDFPKAVKVSAVEVYWFDDTGVGQCRVPASWKLLYRDGSRWKEVQPKGRYGIKKDQINRLEFGNLHTESLRIVVKLQEEFSGGMLEWCVE
jgi:uncharacterized protein